MFLHALLLGKTSIELLNEKKNLTLSTARPKHGPGKEQFLRQ